MSSNVVTSQQPKVEVPPSIDRNTVLSNDFKSINTEDKASIPQEPQIQASAAPDNLVIHTESEELLSHRVNEDPKSENLMTETHQEEDALHPGRLETDNSKVRSDSLNFPPANNNQGESNSPTPGNGPNNQMKQSGMQADEIMINWWPVGGNKHTQRGGSLEGSGKKKLIKKNCWTRIADYLKKRRTRRMIFFVMLFTIYADWYSTIVSISEFWYTKHKAFCAVSISFLLLNVLIRIRYVLKSAPKGEDDYVRAAITVVLNIDTVMLEYTNQMNSDLAVYVDELSVYKLATDNIPQAMLALYCQILDGKMNNTFMVSMVTSLFSLTRASKSFTFNPLKMYQNLSHNSISYKPENVYEELFEYFDTTVEMVARVCMFGAFSYVTEPWGWWIYIVCYLFAFFMYTMILHPNAPNSRHFWAGFFLAAVYTKGEVFYHPFSSYMKDGFWNPRVLVWDQYKYILGWKLVQTISVAVPTGIAIEHFYDLNDFTEMMFYIGIAALGYTFFINYLWDLWAIRRLQKRAFDDLFSYLSLNADLIKIQEKELPKEKTNEIVHKPKFQIHFPGFSISNLFYQKLIPVIFKHKLSRNLDFEMKHSNITPTYGDLMKSFTQILRENPNQENFLLHINYINLKNMEAKLEYITPTSTRIEMFRIYDRERAPEEKVNDKQIIKFVQALEKWTSVRALFLDFSFCTNFTKKSIDKLSITLWKLSEHLKELNLDFCGCEMRFKDLELDHLATRGLTNLTNLLKLELDFSGCRKLTDASIEKLATALSGLTQLDRLQLNFSRCELITDKSLGKIGAGISKLGMLNHLGLNFSGCKEITGIGLEKLAVEGLSKLVQMTRLSLNFNYCSKLTDHGLDKFSKEALCKLTQLINLELKFAECIRLSSEGVGKLSNFGLAQLIWLDELKLDFYFCPKLNDEGVDHLACVLNKLDKLSQLELNFFSCERITDNGLEILILKLMPYINYFTLNFGQCKEITDYGIEQVGTGLLKLSHLHELSLSFESCSITGAGVDAFLDKITGEFLDKLKKLDLNFDWKFNEHTPETRMRVKSIVDMVNNKI